MKLSSLAGLLVVVTSCSSSGTSDSATSSKASTSATSSTIAPAAAMIPTEFTIGPNGKVVKVLDAPKKDVSAKLTADDGASVEVTLKVPDSFRAGTPDEGIRWSVAGADDAHGAQVEIWLVEKEDYDAELERTKHAERTKVLKSERNDKGFVIVSESPVVIAALGRRKVKDNVFVNCQVYFFHDEAPKLSVPAAAWAEATCASITTK